ncbi:hypothetical protein NC651_018922 [Populus alba x Populus x berolinensis]|nr:hypothetical protein NC651_018922 [Populus alba x Populus x berolinensis]
MTVEFRTFEVLPAKIRLFVFHRQAKKFYSMLKLKTSRLPTSNSDETKWEFCNFTELRMQAQDFKHITDCSLRQNLQVQLKVQHLYRDITESNQFDISSALASHCSKLFCSSSKKLSYITNQRQTRQTKIRSKIQLKQVEN